MKVMIENIKKNHKMVVEAVANLPKEAVAIFDYQGASEKEISFKKDDTLILYSKVLLFADNSCVLDMSNF